MGNWYAGREAVKRAAGITGTEADGTVDRLIEAASRRVDSDTGRFFIPLTATRYYDFPNDSYARSWRLWLDEDLISAAVVQTGAQDGSPTTIPAADYYLEPVNSPPYNRLEIDLSSTSVLDSGDASHQRSVSIQGDWGHSAATVSAGAVGSDIANGTVTSIVVTDASLIDVGDTLLIENERLFVRGRGTFDTTTNLGGNLTANKAETTVAVGLGSLVKAGEVILIDAERMLVQSITGNNLQVIRAYDGTTLAAHTAGADVYAFRTLTVDRAVQGTTGAAHVGTTAISVYSPPADVVALTVAYALSMFQQEQASYGRTLGAAEGAFEWSGKALAQLRRDVMDHYAKTYKAAV